METLQINCIYNGKKSVCEFRQGKIDLQFRAGKMIKFDHLTSIDVKGNEIEFHGLYFGSLLKPVKIEINELAPIFKAFKVRILTHSVKFGTMYRDHALTELKTASKGEEIFDVVINKKGQAAKKHFRKLAF